MSAFAPLQLAREIANLPCPRCFGDDTLLSGPCHVCKGLGTVAYEGEWPQVVWWFYGDEPPVLGVVFAESPASRRYLPAPVVIGYDGTSGLLPWLCELYGLGSWDLNGDGDCWTHKDDDFRGPSCADSPLALVQHIIDWAHARAGREPVQ